MTADDPLTNIYSGIGPEIEFNDSNMQRYLYGIDNNQDDPNATLD